MLTGLGGSVTASDAGLLTTYVRNVFLISGFGPSGGYIRIAHRWDTIAQKNGDKVEEVLSLAVAAKEKEAR